MADSTGATACVPTRTLLSAEEKEQLIIEHREVGRRTASRMLSKWNVHLGEGELDGIVDLALCEAAERFDANRGASFATFLFYYVRGALLSWIDESVCETKAKTVLACSVSASRNKAVDLESDPELTSCLDQEVVFSKECSSPEEMMLQEERRAQVSKALQRLEPRTREVLQRLFLKSESLAVIAESLGCNVREVKSLRQSGLQTLRTILVESEIDLPSTSKGSLPAAHLQAICRPVRPRAVSAAVARRIQSRAARLQARAVASIRRAVA